MPNAVAVRRLLFKKDGPGWAGRFIAAVIPSQWAEGNLEGHFGVEHEDKIWNTEGVFFGANRYREFMDGAYGEDHPMSEYMKIVYPNKAEMHNLFVGPTEYGEEKFGHGEGGGFSTRKGSIFTKTRQPKPWPKTEAETQQSIREFLKARRRKGQEINIESSMAIISNAMLRLGYTPPSFP
jgi:hypothetical protein